MDGAVDCNDFDPPIANICPLVPAASGPVYGFATLLLTLVGVLVLRSRKA